MKDGRSERMFQTKKVTVAYIVKKKKLTKTPLFYLVIARDFYV